MCTGCSDSFWYDHDGSNPLHSCPACKVVLNINDTEMISKKLSVASMIHAARSIDNARVRDATRKELASANKTKSASESRRSSLRRVIASKVAASTLEHCGVCSERLVVPSLSREVYVAERCLGCKAWRCSLCMESKPGLCRREPSSCSNPCCSAESTGSNNMDRCPGCGAAYDRGEGCSQVTCSCGTSWVWGQGYSKNLGTDLPGHSNSSQIEVTERLMGDANLSHSHSILFNIHMGMISAVEFDLDMLRNDRSNNSEKMDALVLKTAGYGSHDIQSNLKTKLIDLYANGVYLEHLESVIMQTIASVYGLLKSTDDAGTSVLVAQKVVYIANDRIRILSYNLRRGVFHTISPYDIRISMWPVTSIDERYTAANEWR